MNDEDRIKKHFQQKALDVNLQLDGAGADEYPHFGANAAAVRGQLLVNRAGSFYAMMNYDKATCDCQSALRINPKDEGALFCLANCCFCTRDYNKAIDLYTQMPARTQ